MPDFKKFYARYLLVILGVLTLLAAIWVVLSASSAKEAATLPPPAAKKEPFATDPELAKLEADAQIMAERRTWKENSDNSPFVSRVYLLRDGRLVDILESGNDLFPPIPNSWILEHGLDYLDEKLLERDPDADGFTNLEEYLAKTNPLDASSKPEAWIKLRLADVKIEHLQIIFTGRDASGRAMINSVAAASGTLHGRPIGPTKPYKIGDTIIVSKYRAGYAVKTEDNPTRFKLVGFTTAERENPNITVDGKPQIDHIEIAILASTIPGDPTKVELEANKPKMSPYSLATLVDIRPGGKTFEIRTGESFSLDDAKYKLIDVSEEKATIENLATKEQHSVPKANRELNPKPTPTSEPNP